MPLAKIAIDVSSADVVRVTLHAAPLPGGVPKGVSAQLLTLGGDVPVPLASPVDVSGDAVGTRAAFDLRLRDLPERVLGVDPNHLQLRWEGLDAQGASVVALAGVIDLGDPAQTELSPRKLVDTFARLDDFRVGPGLTKVSVHGLLSLYNPLGFDVAITRLAYTVKVGQQTVLSAQQPSFRIRAGQRGDVLIEQDVPLADAAGAVAGVLRGDPATLDATLVIRTPQGEREVPLHLAAAP